MDIFLGMMLPFIGTIIGSSSVFLMGNKLNNKVEKILLGFAAGVMVAASVWSLLIPSIEMAESQNVSSCIPAIIGFIIGIVFLMVLDNLIRKIKIDNDSKEKEKIKKTSIMAIAITLHNIPEGLAVGVCFAGAISQNAIITIYVKHKVELFTYFGILSQFVVLACF